MSKVLIVVDMQNDFIDGALGFDDAHLVVPVVRKKIQEYHEQKDDVVYTLDTHDDKYLKTEEGKHLPVKHCVKGTKGHALHPEIAEVKKADERVFEKNTFPSMNLGDYLQEKRYDNVELVGLVSNICVIANAVIAKAALPDASIEVDAQATASFDSALHQKALDVMEGMHVVIKNRS